MPNHSEDKRTREELLRENSDLRDKHAAATQYIRQKVNQLLAVMGTAPLRPEELDDATLIELDPISIVSASFAQVLRHLKETNEQLKAAHDELAAIFDSAAMGILVLDRDLRVQAYNRRVKDQFRFEHGVSRGMFCRELICHQERHAQCPARKAVETNAGSHANMIIDARHYDVTATPIRDKNGEVSRIVLVYMDVTERIFAQEQLQRSEERYRDLFENSTDLIQVLGADGSIRYVNRAWLETLGYAKQEIIGVSIFDLVDPDCKDCGPELRRVVCGSKDGTFETMFITKGGRRIIVEGNVSAIAEDGRFAGTRGIFRDVTERKRNEALIAAEREQLAVTLRSIGDGVITTDILGQVVLINKIAHALTGWTQADALGKPIADVFTLEDEVTGERRNCPVDRVLKLGIACELEGNAVLVSRNGARRLITDSVAPILDKDSAIVGTVLVFRDITERKRLEERIVKSEKIESLGVLAGGIAHDFNNLLNAIIGNLDLGLKFSLPDSEVHKSLARAAKASEKAKALTQQLLTFSKGGAPVKKLSAIADLIRDTADFSTRGSTVTCEYSLPDELWNAEIDEGQISQVINNLVINAAQAMPEGGTVRISARNILVTPKEFQELEGGRYVKIVVQDHGRGISREHLGRIFEPYFTTKTGGSGLGLATTYSIIKKHDGLIDVESSGDGAVFSIYLPAAPESAPLSVKPVQFMPRAKIGGKILLMDDDDLIRETSGVMLNLLGYEVDFSVDGSDALARYVKAREAGVPYEAVIMDLTIRGGKGGKETIKDLLALDPSATVIVSSGYSTDAILADYTQSGFSGIIVKPYTMDELGDELRRVLSKKQPEPPPRS